MAKLPWHISGRLHVSGRSRFVGDEAPLSGMLYAKFFFSPVAHAKIKSLDLSAAKAFPGVYAVYGAQDVPGQNMIGQVMIYLALVLTVVSLVDYIAKNKQVLKMQN